MKSEELEKKSKELTNKSEELKEKAHEAEELEQLLEWANMAEGYITDILHNIDDVGIEEPHGLLSEIVYNLVRQIESKFERI